MDRPRAADSRPVARADRVHGHRPPQFLALLPGRRPDLLLDDRLVVRALAPADGGGRLGLVVSAQPAGRDHRQHRPLRPAGDHPRRHARAAPGCAARHVRDRRPDRRARVRLLDGGALDRAAVRRDPALRPALPRQVHRADAAPDVRADAARRLPVDGAADRRRVPRRPWARHPQLARGRARRPRRRLRLLREALERGLLRGTPGCVSDRAALAPGHLLRGRDAPGAAARRALEAARARHAAPLRRRDRRHARDAGDPARLRRARRRNRALREHRLGAPPGQQGLAAGVLLGGQAATVGRARRRGRRCCGARGRKGRSSPSGSTPSSSSRAPPTTLASRTRASSAS